MIEANPSGVPYRAASPRWRNGAAASLEQLLGWLVVSPTFRAEFWADAVAATAAAEASGRVAPVSEDARRLIRLRRPRDKDDLADLISSQSEPRRRYSHSDAA